MTLRRATFLLAAAALSASAASGQANLRVKGLGFFADRDLASRLAFLLDADPSEDLVLDSAVLEDSAFLLLGQLQQMGYLEPAIEAELINGDTSTTVRWESRYAIQLDAAASAERAVFRLQPGVLYYYEDVTVSGVSALTPGQMRRYFIPGGALFARRSDRAFTDENLDRRVNRLLRSLDQAGYRSVRELSRRVDPDPATGAVRVRLEVGQGPLHTVRSVEEVIVSSSGTESRRAETLRDVQFTPDWEQAVRTRLRHAAFTAGYPDARIRMDEALLEPAVDGSIRADVRFTVEQGPKVLLAGVEFREPGIVKDSVLLRQARLRPGGPLNLLEVGEARRRLMGLGIFKTVNPVFEGEDAADRRVIFELEPALEQELQLRAGWGSYEQARAGMRWTHRNPWHRAHQYELNAKASMRSMEGALQYSIPQIFGTRAGAFASAAYAFREEVSFDSTTRGLALGASTTVGGVNLSLEYALQQQDTERLLVDRSVVSEEATVASLLVRAALDRRDNFFAPSSGYQLFVSLQAAARLLGGSVDFLKPEIGLSHHWTLASSTLLHAGVRLGYIHSLGRDDDPVPFSERFFPGGENSVRGYREGRASPLDPEGNLIGAESYALANLELEQRILRNLSLILFVDGVHLAADGVTDGTDTLVSAGLGLRYQTPVGPVRVEYGHNVSRRDLDPHGALHISVGFPF